MIDSFEILCTNLRQKFFVKKVDLLTKIGDTITALGQKRGKNKIGGADSSRRPRTMIRVSRNTDMGICNLVSTPGLQVTEKDMVTEEQLPAVLAGLCRRVDGFPKWQDNDQMHNKPSKSLHEA